MCYNLLQPIVKEIPSYVKDANDFIQKFNQIEELPENSLLVTSVAKPSYTNIPNNEGTKEFKEAYDKHPNKTVSTKVITTFLSLILTLNNLIFNSVSYIQKMGCAMGIVCAPSYANLFMAQFGEKAYIPMRQRFGSLIFKIY